MLLVEVLVEVDDLYGSQVSVQVVALLLVELVVVVLVLVVQSA